MNHRLQKTRNWLRDTLLATAVAMFIVGVHGTMVRAAGPELIITWRASSYAPATFRGKILPTGGATITAAVDLIDGGKVVGLENTRVLWYANEEQLTSGRGVARAVFTAPMVAPNTVNVRVQVEGYQGKFLVKTVAIPIVRPEIVLPPPTVASTSATFEAKPFFFGIKTPVDLLFTWTINGKRTENSEDPTRLILTLPSSGVLQDTDVSLKAVNPLSFRESATVRKIISYP